MPPLSRTVALGAASVAALVAPLPLGPTRSVTRLVLAAIVAAGLLPVLFDRRPAARRLPAGVAALLVASAALPLAWLVPLPPPVFEALAPAVAREARASLAFAGEPEDLAQAERALAARAGGQRQEPGARPLTADPDATIAAAAHVALALAAFALGFFAAGEPRARRILLAAVAVSALAQAAIGLGESFSGHRLLVFDRAVHFPGLPSGTFVNPNHFAALASLGLFALLALAAPDGEHGAAPAARGAAAARRVLTGTCAAILILALAWSSSRAALAAAAAASLLYGVLLQVRTRTRSARWSVLTLSVAAGLSVAALLVKVPAPLADDLATVAENAVTRVEIWRTGSSLAFEALPAGSGPGTFGSLHDLHRAGDMPRRVVHAHNDWIEWWTEAGLAGVVVPAAWLLLLAVTAFGVSCRRSAPSALALACGLVALALHESVDFPLRLVGVSVPAAICGGVLLAAAMPPRGEAPAPGRRFRPNRASLTALSLLAVSTAVWAHAGTRTTVTDGRDDAFGIASAESRRAAARRSLESELERLRDGPLSAHPPGVPGADVGPAVLELQRAALRAPLRAEVRVTQWLAASLLLGPEGASEPENASLLEHYLSRAESLSPASRSRRRTILRYRVAAGQHARARGIARSLIDDDPRLARDVWRALGPAAADLGALMDATPNEPRAAMELAAFLVADRRDPAAARIVLTRARAAHPDDPRLTLRLASLELAEGNTRDAVALAGRVVDGDQEALRRGGLRVTIQALAREGRYDEADAAVDELVELGAPAAITSILRAEVAMRAGRPGDAAALLRETDTALSGPRDALRRHVLLGSALEAMGDLRGALDEFRAAETIDPEDPAVRAFFDRLARAPGSAARD